ncbi:hypothetical protein C8R44DRAFT_990744 [Mycena epipterygia]|nr:hypothetical protein C8R44DRAFT_990744 [Mycena epipterygia]
MTTRSISVKVHSIASNEDWALWLPEVSAIRYTLAAPLPPWCATGPYPSVSSGNLPLVSEISKPPTLLDTDCGDNTQQPLSEAFNLVLSHVSDIRSLIAHYGPSRSAVPFVSSLMRVLAQMCTKDAIIIAETPFVRPRTTTPYEGSLDGMATMLACHSVESFGKGSQYLTDKVDKTTFVRPRTTSPRSDMDDDTSHSSLPEVYPMSVDSESDCSSSGASSIDVPLEAHVLPGRGKHIYAVLPFLCVADKDNIVDLVSSVACQRHVWGIHWPAVGFALSKSATIAKLTLSWVDSDTRIVHVASPVLSTNSKQSATLGIFDLTNVAEALSFTQLVLGLSQDFAAISACAKTGCQNNRFCWRSDNISSEDSDYRQDRVSRWVCEVEASSGKSLSLPPTPPSNPPQEASAHSPEFSDKAMTSNPKKTMTTSSEQSDNLRILPSISRSKPTSKQNPKSRMSSSSFAAQSATGLVEDKPQIQTWMFDRLVQRLGRIRFQAGIPIPEKTEINTMLELYGTMCDYRGVNWNKSDHPPVDSVLSDARDALVTELQSDSNLPRLSSVHKALLFGRLSALLSATAGASLLDAKRSDLSVYEAESRHAWDTLLYHFYIAGDEKISPYVLLEHTIHFARNIFADRLKTDRFVSAAENNNKLCGNAVAEAPALGLLVAEQANEAVTQATRFYFSVKGMQEDKLTEAVRQRSDIEPRDGKCDAILFMSIPDASVEVANAADIIRYTAPSPPASNISGTGLLQNPFLAAPTPAGNSLLQYTQMVPSFKGHLLLPHATVEYKKRDDTTAKALNQGRMYLVSVVSFYSALGIQDFPFYCLLTSGTLGAILMGWQSSTQEQLYLVERDVQTFDISSPRQAFYFATFLLRLRENQAELRLRVEERLPADINLERVRKWHKSAQLQEIENKRAGGRVPSTQ